MYSGGTKKKMDDQQAYETGDVTGYAQVPNNKNSYGGAEYGHPGDGGSWNGDAPEPGPWSDESVDIGWHDSGGNTRAYIDTFYYFIN